MRRQQEENRQYIEQEKEKLRREKEEGVRVYKEKMAALEKSGQADIRSDSQGKADRSECTDTGKDGNE